MKAVINLFGGPGTGKSTIASGLFYEMKIKHLSVEYCVEYAKELTFEERHNIITTDQLYIFAKQHRKLYRLLDIYDYVILDSPIVMGLVYFNNKNIYEYKLLKDLIMDTFEKYPNINYLLKREDKYYTKIGRNQNLEESKKLDKKIKDLLENNEIDYDKLVVNKNSHKTILNKVLKTLENKPRRMKNDKI